MSMSVVLGEAVDAGNSLGDGIVLVDGGGSIAECVVGALEGTTGSGRSTIGSSLECVSMVI